MKAKIVGIAVSALMAGSVTAAEFSHPDAEAVALTGLGTAQVCNYNRDYPTPKWICYDRILRGARAPVVVTLPQPGPVVIRNASWAFAMEPCESGRIVLTGEIDPPLLPPKLNSDLLASGDFGVCSGWIPLEPGQPMK